MWPFKKKPKTYSYSIYKYGLTVMDSLTTRNTIAPPAGKEVVAVVPSGDEHVLILWKEESEHSK